MATLIKSSLENLRSFLQDHQVSFVNGLLILFTVSGEQIFKESTFECPCKHPVAFVYALFFLIGPFIVLYLIGVAVSNQTWRLFHGWCYRDKEQSNENKSACLNFSMVLSRSAVVPLAWLFVAFLDGNYYACMHSQKPCEKEWNGTMPEDYRYYKKQSQIFSWIGLIAVTALVFLVTCFVRCYDSVTYLQNKYIRTYRDEELQQFDNHIQVWAKKKAEENVKVFLTNKQSDKKLWDKISKMPKIDLEKKAVPKTEQQAETEVDTIELTYLSSLNEWVSEVKPATSIQTPEETTNEETTNPSQQQTTTT